MPRRALVLTALIGCSSGGAASLVARAHALENAAGSKRDYAAATALYAQACNDGAGDQTGCRLLVTAILRARGADHVIERSARVATASCKHHDDAFLCWWASITNERSTDPAIEAALARARTASCDAAHLDRCEAPDASDGDRPTKAPDPAAWRALAARACGLGEIDDCSKLVIDLSHCAYAPKSEGCVARVTAGWTAAGAHVELDALAVLQHACTAGDADACAVLPGREIAPADLCAAHDYNASLCVGDTASLEIARAHHGDAAGDERCRAFALRQSPPRSQVHPGWPKSCDDLEAARARLATCKATLPDYTTQMFADLKPILDHAVDAPYAAIRGADSTCSQLTSFIVRAGC